MEWMKIPGHNSTETNFLQTPWKGEVSWTKITYVPTNIASTLGPTSWYLDRLFTCTHVDLLHGCLLILIQIMNERYMNREWMNVIKGEGGNMGKISKALQYHGGRSIQATLNASSSW